MPWQNNGNGDKPNPWGGGPRRGGGGGGEPPQIDEFIKKGQEQLRAVLPGGGRGISLILLAAFGLWIASGIYTVEPNEQGVVLQFGKRSVTSAAPGLHWHIPYPVETVEVRGVTDEKTISIGSRTTTSRRAGRQTSATLDESLMLTQDENIVDVRFNVVWRIKDLGDYLFQLQDPDGTIKAVSESVMRELVGKNKIALIITKARGALEEGALLKIQKTLDEYKTGVTVLRVQIIESEAPDEVKDAFLDVQRAEADEQKSRNVAAKYANEVIPKAQGRAEQLTQQAEGYRAQTVARAEGEAARFLSVYKEYSVAKKVTQKRIYLETMEGILSGMDKIILDSKGGSGVVPYLPLNELGKKKSGGN